MFQRCLLSAMELPFRIGSNLAPWYHNIGRHWQSSSRIWPKKQGRSLQVDKTTWETSWQKRSETSWEDKPKKLDTQKRFAFHVALCCLWPSKLGRKKNCFWTADSIYSIQMYKDVGNWQDRRQFASYKRKLDLFPYKPWNHTSCKNQTQTIWETA